MAPEIKIGLIICTLGLVNVFLNDTASREGTTAGKRV